MQKIYDADFYSSRAIKEGKRARSYYKLEEIDQKFSLIKNSKKPLKILDLGCTPGSWSQYVFDVKSKSEVYGIDLKEIESFPKSFNYSFIQGNVENLDEFLFKLDFPHFNLILSDMAPSTTGNRNSDSYLSYKLVLKVLEITQKWLIPGGKWVAKYFEGYEIKDLKQAISKNNKIIKLLRLKTTKKKSPEIFILAEKLSLN